MENSKEKKEVLLKLNQIIDLSFKQIAYSMFQDGHTMDEITENLHLGKQTVVKILAGLKKKSNKPK